MLGLCYDSGHDFVWSGKPYDLLKRYGDRLFAVHLHDNRGREDEHLPIGEGDVNWETVRQGIGDSAYAGSFTLEGDSAVIPPTRTPQEHLKLLYRGPAGCCRAFPGKRTQCGIDGKPEFYESAARAAALFSFSLFLLF